MKKSIIVFFSVLFFTSCSTDNDADNDIQEEVSGLVGTWNLTDVRFSGEAGGLEVNLADQIVDALVAEDCVLVSFTFNEDGTAVSENSVQFLEINAGLTGLDVSCPTDTTIDTTQWSLDGDQLTFINEDLEEETITIQLDGTTLIISGEDIDSDNFSEGEAIFTRQ